MSCINYRIPDVLRYPLLCTLILSLFGCSSEPETVVDSIRARGELLVITRNSPTTFYEGPQGPVGFEYDLLSRFARHLGVKLRLIVPDSFEEILPMVVRGEANLAAAGLSITEDRSKIVRFGPTYQTITQQLVYNLNQNRPKSVDDIHPGQLEVVAGSAHVERLKELQQKHPKLQWKENRELESEELLNLVFEQVIDYTVADSNELALFRRYHRDVESAFSISEPQQLAWAFPYHTDDSLINEARKFFDKIQKNGRLEQLRERYYGHIEQLDYVGTRLYTRHVKQVLPEFRPLFQKAAKLYKLDWRLLAAIGYQESHWRPKAMSPTGVRGIMMLTQATAAEIGIEDRLDPEASILGGAQYFRETLDRIPERIPRPDRIWLALAAYNVGFYHLDDARIITQMNGGDPDKWVDVKKNLPLLSQSKWYKKVEHGYARGNEPVNYVENIRIYYDLLVWLDNKDRGYQVKPKSPVTGVNSPAF